MKTLTVRELNRRTANVVDALERGESFELRRNGKAIGYITRTPPARDHRPNWAAHFRWLQKQDVTKDEEALAQFDEERQRQADREKDMGNLK